MNKGQLIRAHIEAGVSNEAILPLMEMAGLQTTINSIRWHRSKMKAAPKSRPARMSKQTMLCDALRENGLEGLIKEGLDRLLCAPKTAGHVWTLLEEWTLRVNSEVTGRSGRCCYGRREVEVHEVLLDRPADLRQTLVHEVAHAVDVMINGRSSHHGYAWQRIMSHGFRVEARRCSSEAVSRVLRAKRDENRGEPLATWECARCGFEDKVYGKRKQAPEMYKHKRCGGHFRAKE